MVKGFATALGLTAFALPALAQSPRDQMFPAENTCYARDYSPDHLQSHPAQRVTSISLTPDPGTASDQLLRLWVKVSLRGQPGGEFEALSYCENTGGELYCGMEGDAGGFAIAPAKNGGVLVTVSSLGMGFENESGFVTLERNSGDDRSFLLGKARGCR